MNETTRVEIHVCVENGDHVVIRAEVVKNDHRGDFTRLMAHSPRCKTVRSKKNSADE